MKPNIIRLSPADNVAVAITPLIEGTHLEGADVDVSASQNVPEYHKVALAEIPEGGAILKYGEPIGAARIRILPGDHVHVHNLKPEEEC